MTFPNKGDLVNAYNDTGWPGHYPNDNDIAYWTTGTNNPKWVKDDPGETMKRFYYDVLAYARNHSSSGAQAKLDQIKTIVS